METPEWLPEDERDTMNVVQELLSDPPNASYAKFFHDMPGLEIMELYRQQELEGGMPPEGIFLINEFQRRGNKTYADEKMVGPWPATKTRSYATQDRLALQSLSSRDNLSVEERITKRMEMTTPCGISALGDALHMAYRNEASALGDLMDMEWLRLSLKPKELAAYAAFERLEQVRRDYAKCVQKNLMSLDGNNDEAGKFATAYEIPDNVLAWEGRPCGKAEFTEALMVALDAFSPKNLPSIPIYIHRHTIAKEHWRAFLEQGGTGIDINNDHLRLPVPNHHGSMRNGLERDMQKLLSFIDPDATNVLEKPADRAAMLRKLEKIRSESGHLGGTLLLLRSAGRRALNHEKTHSLVVRTCGNMPIIGECFRIVETMNILRDTYLGPAIRKLYTGYEGLHCDDNQLFMMTGGLGFIKTLKGQEWQAIWHSILAVQRDISLHQESFDRDFNYPVHNERIAAEQIRRSLDAMNFFVRCGVLNAFS